jgi:hypothetical protein
MSQKSTKRTIAFHLSPLLTEHKKDHENQGPGLKKVKPVNVVSILPP